MQLNVRPMQPTDQEALIDLKWELNRVEINRMPDAHPLKAERDAARSAAEFGVATYIKTSTERSGEILVASNADRVVGCVVWYPELGSASIRESSRWRGHVAGFVVAEDQRGQGVGKALFAEVERRVRARGLSRMVLGVVAWNGASIEFYERAGFIATEVVMTKVLA